MGLPSDILNIETADKELAGLQGDTFYLELTAEDNNGNAINIAGCAIDFTISTARSPNDGMAVSGTEADILNDGSDGKYYLKAASTIMAALTATENSTRYGYYRVRFSKDGEIRTVFRGEFRLPPDLDS